MKSFAVLSLLAPLAAAHYSLVWPPARSQDHEEEPKFPCGGVDSAQSNRTQYPLTGGPIQLKLGHTRTLVQVVLAVGNNPDGSAFNTVITPTFEVDGVQNFCLGAGALQLPSSVKEGTNGTIQVITNGDPSGGLYTCTDVTFTSQALSQADYNSHCNNATGIQVRAVAAGQFANGTTSSSGSGTSSSSTSGTSGTATGTTTSSSTGAGAAQTTSSTSSRPTGAAAQATALAWGIAAAGVAAGAMVL